MFKLSACITITIAYYYSEELAVASTNIALLYINRKLIN